MRFSVLFLSVLGCSLGNINVEPCQQHSECRDEFGFGWVCGDQGYCEALVPGNRCEDPYPDDLFERSENYSDAIVIGTLFDHETDEENIRSIELAVDEANIDGGLHGTKFGMVHCNYAADLSLDADDSEVVAKKLTTWLSDAVGAHAIVGPGTSALSLAIWPEAQSSGTLVMAPSATSDELTTLDGAISTDEAPGLFWRTAPPDSVQASTIVGDIQRRGSVSVAVIYLTNTYGQGLADGISAGISTATLYPFENSNDLTAAISDVGVAGVDEVVFISSEPADVSGFLNGAAASELYAHTAIFLTDAARDAAVLEDASNAVALFPNVRGTVPIADPGSAALVSTFNSAYSQRYGEDASLDGFNTFSYDAAWLTLYGIAWADAQESGQSGLGIAKGLRHVSEGPEVLVRAASWSDVVEAFGRGESIDVKGASGNLDFDATTGETVTPIAIWTLVQNSGDWGFTNNLICYPSGLCEPPS